MKRMPDGWTAEMDATLLRVFPMGGAAAVSAAVSRSYAACARRANRLGIHLNRRGKRPGGTALIDRLARAVIDAGPAGLATSEFCARNPSDNVLSVRSTIGRLGDEGRAFCIGHQCTRRWFATQDGADQYAAAHHAPTYRERVHAERAARIAERQAAREHRAQVAAAEKAARAVQHPRQAWTDAENRYLQKHYPAEGAKFVAPVLGRSVTAVTAQAAKLGVKCHVPVQLIGYVKKALAPKAAPAPKKRRVALAPALPKAAPKSRGPALSDGPVLYHPDFKFTRAPTRPPALRTNTHAMY